MTKQEAKELSIEVWRYRVDHPQANLSPKLPTELYDRIKHLYNHCPLCELFCKGSRDCKKDCPLVVADANCTDDRSPYIRWGTARFSETHIRKQAALEILTTIKAWEPEVKE